MGRCPDGVSAGGLFGGGQKKGFQTEIQNDLVQEIEALLGHQAIQDLDFEAVEMAARRQALRLAARALEQRLNADTSDHAGPEVPCSCGGSAQYHGRHQKTFESVLGALHLERAYYYCAPCQSGFCPRDHALRMEMFSLTPGVLRMTGSTAAMVSFEESSALLQELAGVEISAKQVERAAEALASRSLPMSAVAWRRWAQWLLPRTWGWTVPACRCASPKSPVALASSRTVPPKLAMPSSSPCGPPNREMRKTTPCAIPVRSLIRPRLKAPLLRIRAPTDPTSPSAYYAKRRGEASRKHPACVVLGDGAAWIWNTARELFPQATHILDRFHAKEVLHRTAQSIFGATSEGKQWAVARCADLDAGKLHAIIHALQPHTATFAEATKCAGYIFRNRARMRYPKFHSKSLCTSTGVLEAGCKVVIGTRLKRAGMHWTVKGADAIIALRCSKLSGRFEDFWERRYDRAAA